MPQNESAKISSETQFISTTPFAARQSTKRARILATPVTRAHMAMYKEMTNLV